MCEGKKIEENTSASIIYFTRQPGALLPYRFPVTIGDLTKADETTPERKKQRHGSRSSNNICYKELALSLYYRTVDN
jgi:hypothetical protein